MAHGCCQDEERCFTLRCVSHFRSGQHCSVRAAVIVKTRWILVTFYKEQSSILKGQLRNSCNSFLTVVVNHLSAESFSPPTHKCPSVFSSMQSSKFVGFKQFLSHQKPQIEKNILTCLTQNAPTPTPPGEVVCWLIIQMVTLLSLPNIISLLEKNLAKDNEDKQILHMKGRGSSILKAAPKDVPCQPLIILTRALLPPDQTRANEIQATLCAQWQHQSPAGAPSGCFYLSSLSCLKTIRFNRQTNSNTGRCCSLVPQRAAKRRSASFPVGSQASGLPRASSFLSRQTANRRSSVSDPSLCFLFHSFACFISKQQSQTSSVSPAQEHGNCFPLKRQTVITAPSTPQGELSGIFLKHTLHSFPLNNENKAFSIP